MRKSNLVFFSNVYILNGCGKLSDSKFMEQVIDPGAIDAIVEHKRKTGGIVRLSPHQEEIKRNYMPCSYSNGDFTHGAIKEEGKVVYVNKCENTACEFFAKCSRESNFRHIQRDKDATFAFVTRKLTSLGQLFILTHNFLFFKEMKTWSVYQKNVKYFYTKRSENFLLFENMPNSLKNRSSDYLYLFETVYKMSTKDKLTDDEIESCANFARRLLEGFVKFKNLKNTNNGSSFFNKFRELQAITIDEVKKARIYRFVNMFSHDDESFALYPEIDYTALIANAQEIIKDLLKFIEEIDKFHYDSAISAIS